MVVIVVAKHAGAPCDCGWGASGVVGVFASEDAARKHLDPRVQVYNQAKAWRARMVASTVGEWRAWAKAHAPALHEAGCAHTWTQDRFSIQAAWEAENPRPVQSVPPLAGYTLHTMRVEE